MLLEIEYVEPFNISLDGKKKYKKKYINIFQIIEAESNKNGFKLKMSDGSSYQIDTPLNDFHFEVNQLLKSMQPAPPLPPPPPLPPGSSGSEEIEIEEKDDEGSFTAKRNLNFQL